MRSAKSDKQESRDWLADVLKKGDTVYTVLRSVSRSGMQRRIDLFTIRDNRMLYLSRHAAEVLGMRVSEKGGIVTNGCGMDMGFHLVYNLSMALFCPGKYDHDSAYALRHEWI